MVNRHPLVGDTAVCSSCAERKPLDEFGRDNRAVSRKGYKAACRKCCAKLTLAWKRRTGYVIPKDRHRMYRIKYMYGLSERQYATILERQSGLCAVCFKPPEPGTLLRVDHDHSTGQVRGLLCGPCNTGIGMLGDSYDRLRSAMRYLASADTDAEEVQHGQTEP